MKVITQPQLNAWLDRLTQTHRIVAPMMHQGKSHYGAVASSADIEWDVERTDLSPKTWLFPATESTFTVRQTQDSTTIVEAPAPLPTVLFAVRPCDARGLSAIDALFLDKAPADGQYARHRAATAWIGLSCPQMWETCFCTVVGGAPNSTAGLDILLTAVQEGSQAVYGLQVLTERGRDLASSASAVERDLLLPQPNLTAGLPTLRSTVEWKARFNDAYWQRIGDRCLACRACTFVCPACRCFDVRDEVVSRHPGEQVFARLRAWDACTSEPYRRIAGGHNPRPTQQSRLRNRFYCKFMYYPDDYGPLGCVGCGRCIDACPVNIDILEVIASVEQMPDSQTK